MIESFKKRVLCAFNRSNAAAAAVAVNDDCFYDTHERLDGWELVSSETCISGNIDNSSVPKTALSRHGSSCPPGGEEAVVLYTTTLQAVRRTYEECNKVRSLLQNLRVAFRERDVSMDLLFRAQLWGLLGDRVPPPRLFAYGRLVGGADEVVALHEGGHLVPLLKKAIRHPSLEPAIGVPGLCEDCNGDKFSVCSECNGSRKVIVVGSADATRCRRCNENGLVPCRACC